MNQIKSVCVYGASSTKIDPVYFEAARRLGCLLAERCIQLINGAGSFGLMRAATDGVIDNGGEAVGIIPHFMVEQGWQYERMTRIIEVSGMHERKQLMANMSDAVIALPGGVGTLDELMEIITWKQLALYLNPVVILNTNNFYGPLLGMLQKAMDENFMRPSHGALWHVAETPEEAIELIHNIPVWDVSIRKFAAI